MDSRIVAVEQVLLRKNEHLNRIIKALVERLGGSVDLSSEDIAASDMATIGWMENDGDMTLTTIGKERG